MSAHVGAGYVTQQPQQPPSVMTSPPPMAVAPPKEEKKSYMKISSDIRGLIVDNYVKQKRSLNEVAKIFSVPRSTVWNIVKSYKKSHNIEMKPGPGGRKKKFNQKDIDFVTKAYNENPNSCLSSIKTSYEEHHPGQKISVTTIFTMLKQESAKGQSLKKPSRKMNPALTDEFFNRYKVVANDLDSHIYVGVIRQEIKKADPYVDSKPFSYYIVLSICTNGVLSYAISPDAETFKTNVEKFVEAAITKAMTSFPSFSKGGHVFCCINEFISEPKLKEIVEQHRFNLAMLPAPQYSPVEAIRDKLSMQVQQSVGSPPDTIATFIDRLTLVDLKLEIEKTRDIILSEKQAMCAQI